MSAKRKKGDRVHVEHANPILALFDDVAEIIEISGPKSRPDKQRAKVKSIATGKEGWFDLELLK